MDLFHIGIYFCNFAVHGSYRLGVLCHFVWRCPRLQQLCPRFRRAHNRRSWSIPTTLGKSTLLETSITTTTPTMSTTIPTADEIELFQNSIFFVVKIAVHDRRQLCVVRDLVRCRRLRRCQRFLRAHTIVGHGLGRWCLFCLLDW